MMLPQEKVRIMHFIHTMAYGGIETVLINWIKGLDADQFEIHLVCFKDKNGSEKPFMDVAMSEGLHIVTIPWSRRKPVFLATRELVRLIKKYRIDILHSHNCYADVIAAIASLFTPVKTVTTAYVWADFEWKRNLIQRLNQFAMGFMDHITAHCEITQRQTAKMFPGYDVDTLIAGYQVKKFEISAADRQAKRMIHGVADDHVLLLNIARLYPEKEQAFLLKAFQKLHEKHPQLRLWIAGVGPLEDELKALCTKLELDDWVSFLGFVDLSEVTHLADIQVHPSSMEGVPLAICEGLAAGLPIVSSDAGGLPEVIHHDKTGMLFESMNMPQFIGSVERLLNDPELQKVLGENAYNFIRQDYSIQKAVNDLQQVYFKMLQPERICSEKSLRE